MNGWANFYQIVGSSAGALTGLQFIVITLIAGRRAGGTMKEIHAFGTPTVVHFCVALLLSAVMNAPWSHLDRLALCIGVCGGVGTVYSLRVLRHAHRATYNPDAGDWFWYTALPFALYAVLVVAAFLFQLHLDLSLVLVAICTLLFLFVGVHNAWDTVTYLATKDYEDSIGKNDDPDQS